MFNLDLGGLGKALTGLSGMGGLTEGISPFGMAEGIHGMNPLGIFGQFLGVPGLSDLRKRNPAQPAQPADGQAPASAGGGMSPYARLLGLIQ